jgi:hypothetical protein
LIAETLNRRLSHPDAASVLRTASIPDCRVWERRLDQRGFGTVRLGLADQASRQKVRRGGNRVSAGVVRSVPFTVDLRAESVGLAGPFDVVRSCARWLVGQLAVAHSPADVPWGGRPMAAVASRGGVGRPDARRGAAKGFAGYRLRAQSRSRPAHGRRDAGVHASHRSRRRQRAVPYSKRRSTRCSSLSVTSSARIRVSSPTTTSRGSPSSGGGMNGN